MERGENSVKSSEAKDPDQTNHEMGRRAIEIVTNPDLTAEEKEKEIVQAIEKQIASDPDFERAVRRQVVINKTSNDFFAMVKSGHGPIRYSVAQRRFGRAVRRSKR